MANFKKTEIGEIPESWGDRDRFINAINQFRKEEHFILTHDLNERTITHKLAEYLQRAFDSYNVDCEYNKMKKDEDFDTKRLGLDPTRIFSDDKKGTTVYPDIIVHNRENGEENYLVIEVKKKCANGRRDFDFKKLRAFTSQLNYRYGIYLEFDNDKVSDLKFFPDGGLLE